MEATPPRPLLTIAIPTWNRSRFLAESLEALTPQLAGLSQVEVRIHDNASSDDTPAVVSSFQSRGVTLDYRRQPTNIGADANFVDCFNSARGRYVWVLSDDDIVTAGALAKLTSLLERDTYALVYVTDFPFRENAAREARPDPYRRNVHVFRDRLQFARTVSVWLTFISGIVANKELLEGIPHEPIENAVGSNLVQLSWSLPLLSNLDQGVVLYDRLIGARQGNSGNYSFGSVFGSQFANLTRKYLADQPQLADAILHNAVRSWMPAQFAALVTQRGAAVMVTTEERKELRSAYGNDWRFWFFVWPVLRLPPRLAWGWAKLGRQISNVLTFIRSPQRLRRNIP